MDFSLQVSNLILQSTYEKKRLLSSITNRIMKKKNL